MISISEVKMLEFEINYIHYHLAVQKAHWSLIKHIEINTDTAQEVEIRIESSPAFTFPSVQKRRLIPGYNKVEDLMVTLDGEALRKVTEITTFVLDVKVVDEAGKILVSRAINVRAHPLDMFCNSLPEETASCYVLPNHPYVQKLCKTAQGIFGRSIEGYGGHAPESIKALVKAIYTAIQQEKLLYCIYPENASGDFCSQRIRLPDKIERDKAANCMDSTLLFAACVQNFGFRAHMIFVPHHVFLGVALKNEHLPMSASRAERVRFVMDMKARGLFLPVECTCTLQEFTVSFEKAVATGMKEMDEKRITPIDIQSCRKKYPPIPILESPLPDAEPKPDTEPKPAPKPAPDTEPKPDAEPMPDTEPKPAPKPAPKPVPELPPLQPIPMPKKPESKPGSDPAQARYEQFSDTLFDLGGGNPLLSTGFAKRSSLPVTVRSCGKLLRDLEQKAAIRPARENASGYESLRAEEDGLTAAFGKDDIERILRKLSNTSDEIRSESGDTALQLGIGVLRYQDEQGAAHEAPVLLQPVRIVRENSAWALAAAGAPSINDALRLRLQGSMELPEDIAKFDVWRPAHPGVHYFPQAGVLGVFRSSGYAIYKELEKAEPLNNPVIRSFCEQKLAFSSKNVEDWTKHVIPNKPPLPFPLDESQIAALEGTLYGKAPLNVLAGPPGAGKTLTQAAIGAAMGASGKHLLVVGAKQASLDVLVKRLEAAGLKDRILRIPDDGNTDKVKAALSQAIDHRATDCSGDLHAKELTLTQLRAREKMYLDRLHRIRPCGKSLLQLLEQVHLDPAPTAPLLRGKALQDKADAIQRQIDVLQRADAATAALDPLHHPLRGMVNRPLDLDQQYGLRTALATRKETLTHLGEDGSRLAKALGLPVPLSKPDLTNLGDLVVEANDLFTTLGNRNIPDTAGLRQALNELQSRSVTLKQKRTALTTTFSPKAFDLDAVALRRDLMNGTSFFLRGSAKRSLTEQLQPFARRSLTGKDAVDALDQLAEYQGCRQELEIVRESLHAYGLRSESDAALLCEGEELGEKIERLQASGALPALTANRELLAPFAENWKNTAVWIAQEPDKDRVVEHALARVIDQEAALDQIAEWSNYLRVLMEACDLGLAEQAEKSYNGQATCKEFIASLSRTLSNRYITAEPDLNNFSSIQMATLQEKIAPAAKAYHDAAKKAIPALLPNVDMTRASSVGTEAGHLRTWLLSPKRGGLRDIFAKSPNLILELCPIVLASPETVSRYLPPEVKFDLCMFDEASRIPPAMAFPAILRANRCVVCGDEKQMPPFMTFTTQRAGAEELPSSILAAALGVCAPTFELKTCYRAQGDDLISFSANKYYGGKLASFPAAQAGAKLRLIHVDGTFDHGKTRVNKAEAEAIVKTVEEYNRRDPACEIGIVTMNVQQKELVSQMLSEKKLKVSWVKNLEVLQGEEADVTMISVAFDGKASLNFGPLNNAVEGPRRLNVAVSRARKEMLVFCSLEPEQLPEDGPLNDLRQFLLFAAGRRAEALLETCEPPKASTVAEELRHALVNAGINAELGVGLSSRRVDLAVKNARGDYSLAILVDPRMDEFPVQLQHRGWKKILPVYSLGYYNSPVDVSKSVVAEAKKALAG